MIANGKAFQAFNSQSCGIYTLLYLKTRARGYTLQDFLKRFSDHDYVSNVHQVGKILKQMIVDKDKTWHQVCGRPSNQACC